MQPKITFYDDKPSPGNGVKLGSIRGFEPSDITIRARKSGVHRHTAEVVTPSPSEYMTYIHFSVESRTKLEAVDFCMAFCQSEGFQRSDIKIDPPIE